MISKNNYMKFIIYDIDKKEELIPKFLILIFWPATSCKSKEKVITSTGIAASKKIIQKHSITAKDIKKQLEIKN